MYTQEVHYCVKWGTFKLSCHPWWTFATDDRFQKFLMVLIFFDAISMAISGELPDNTSAAIVTVKLLLNFLDSFTLILFSIEIALKWLDNFTNFWKSGWNIFDFFVTFLVRFCLWSATFSYFIGDRVCVYTAIIIHNFPWGHGWHLLYTEYKRMYVQCVPVFPI